MFQNHDQLQSYMCERMDFFLCEQEGETLDQSNKTQVYVMKRIKL